MRYEARFRGTTVRHMSLRPGFRGRGTHGRARTAGVGAVTLTVLPDFLLLTWHFRTPARYVPVAEQAVMVNLLGPIRLTAALMPALLAQPRATVMTLSGGVAFVPMTITPTYSATKAAIHSWSQSLRFQLRDTNARVLELAPPYVQSELFTPEGEILVQGVQALRFAERDSAYDQRFADVNSMQW